ncbi:MAG: hypothetical protein ABJQ90_00050 [Parasphingorhabdus sp.]
MTSALLGLSLHSIAKSSDALFEVPGIDVVAQYTYIAAAAHRARIRMQAERKREEITQGTGLAWDGIACSKPGESAIQQQQVDAA